MKNNIIYLLLAIILMPACTEKMDLDPEQAAKLLSIEAQLSDEFKKHKVIISEAKRVTDTIIPYVTGAKLLLINSNNDTVKYVESDSIPGIYLTEVAMKGEYGVTYELLITNIDYNYDGIIDTTRAVETMPTFVKLDSTGVERFKLPKFEMEGWFLTCYAIDPPEENYYMFKAWKNDTLVTDTLYEYGITDDALFNGNYTNGVQTIFLDENKDDEYVRPGDKLTLGLYHITKNTYDFFDQAQTEVRNSNPVFGGPPANITTNFTGNIMGCFEVYAVSKQSTIAPPGISE